MKILKTRNLIFIVVIFMLFFSLSVTAAIEPINPDKIEILADENSFILRFYNYDLDKLYMDFSVFFPGPGSFAYLWKVEFQYIVGWIIIMGPNGQPIVTPQWSPIVELRSGWSLGGLSITPKIDQYILVHHSTDPNHVVDFKIIATQTYLNIHGETTKVVSVGEDFSVSHSRAPVIQNYCYKIDIE